MTPKHLRDGIRLLGLDKNGAEFLHDFDSISEGREAVPADAIDWVIFQKVKPGKYTCVGETLDSIDAVHP